MKEKRGLSSSEQYAKNSNRKLLIFGFLLLVIFFVALALMPDNNNQVKIDSPIVFDNELDGPSNQKNGDLVDFVDQQAQLKVVPEQVEMNNVVIGSQVEALVKLTAENTPILYKGASFSENQQDGFSFETTCKENETLQPGDECIIKVLWNPISLRQIQNILTIQWEEDTDRSAGYSSREKTTDITVKAQSTDSKDCVICETINKDEIVEELKKAMGLGGELYPISKDGEVIIDGVPYKVAEGERIIKDKNGKIIAVVPPKKLPISLKNEIMGTISATGDVIAPDGTKLGRLLGDDTIVDSDLNVLGGAVPVVAAMDMRGKLIGRMLDDGTVIDANKSVIGKPVANGSIVDLNGKVIGVLKPWGLVADLNGQIIGAILPNGQVMNADNEVVGTARPNGLIVNATNDLIGGTIPQGVAVSAGCQMVGKILQNGEVKDAYDQTVGRALIDGSIINEKGADVGTAVSMGLVINEKSEIVGFVNSEGKAVGPKGTVIGCINPDGSVAAGKKSIGSILPKGRIIGYGCEQIGSVFPDGSAVNDFIANVGRVYPDYYVRNKENKIIGVVIPRASAIADGCRLLGLVGYTGDIENSTGEIIGCMSPEKTVIDKDGTQIGALAIRGIVVNDKGDIIGRVRLDGKVMDLTGKIIGCLQEDGSVISLSGETIGNFIDTSNIGLAPTTGAILGADGNPKDWTIQNGIVYDSTGKPIGIVNPNGMITANNGKFMGFIPPDGVVVSPEGLILGRVSSKSGFAVNQAGEKFARILPDLTAVSGTTNKIVGSLIPDKTTFMNLKSEYMAKMNLDGTLRDDNGEVIGVIRANKTVTDKDGTIIGYQIPTGEKILSVLGKEVGTVNAKGEIVSAKKTKIGKVLFNGLAVSADNKIIGGVFNQKAIAFGPESLIGYPNMMGQILDDNGNAIAQATPFGLVVTENAVIGRMLPLAAYTNEQNELIGWTSFDADLMGVNSKSIGRLLSNGLALDKSGEEIGYIVKRGITVSPNGKFFSQMSIDNTVLDAKEKAALNGSDYLYNSMSESVARLLPLGIGVNTEGKFIGWLQDNGTIGTGKDTAGLVWNDNRVVNSTGEIVGSYIPLNTVGYTDSTEKNYLVDTEGNIITPKGTIKGTVIAPESALLNGDFVARLTSSDLFVAHNERPKAMSLISTTGESFRLGSKKVDGSVMMNAYSINLTNDVQGSTLSVGAPVTNTLVALGKENISGSVLYRGKKNIYTAGTRALYDTNGGISGMILPVSTFVGKSGLAIGYSPVSSTVLNQDGKSVAVQMPFGFALTNNNLWAGGKAPFGTAVDDDANLLGVIASDGAVIGKDNQMVARALPDGTVANIKDRALYNTMPQKGGIVKQGLAFHYKNHVIGRTTLSGDVLDANDKKVRRILDDGSILGKDMPLDGFVLPFTVAISQEGAFMGTLTSDAQITTPSGDKKGYIAVNGAVKQGTYKITGALASPYLITNDCKVIGQTTFNGKVIDAKGTVLGHIQPDKWAISPAGEQLGRLARNGIVVSPEGTYLGRTLPDSTVVDPQGVNIGCSRNDGSVVDSNGNVIGGTIERGLILDENGNPIGRIKLDGSIVNKENEHIGKILADGSAVNDKGELIGRNVAPDQELLIDPATGKIKGTLSTGGEVRNNKGELLYTVKPNGDIVAPDGTLLGQLSENGELPPHLAGASIVYDKNGNPIGIVSGCDYLSLQEEKIGSILPNGTIVDLNGEVIFNIKADGTLTDLDGNHIATIRSIDLNLEKCGIKSDMLSDEELAARYGATGTSISFGGKEYSVTPDKSIVDKDGKIIGYIENGKPYTLDGRPLSVDGNEHGRIRPKILDKKFKATPEQIQQMQEVLSKRREGMKAGMQSKGVITPNARIQAMARKKADANWDSIGVGKIVSSYPVDMSRMILKDKAIPAVLTRSIDSRYATAPVTAIVERHIYSESGRNIIIPAGSRLIGTFAGEQGTDKRVAKLEITWQRLIRPDGGAFSFEGTSGDAQGRGGVAAYLDDQLVKKFGKPIMTSVVTSAISYMMASNDDMYHDMYGGTVTTSKAEAANDARKNFIDSMQVIFDQLIQDSTNIPVVIFVPSGTRLTVFANEDLWLRSQEDDISEAEAPEKEISKPDTPSWIDNRTSPTAEEEEEEDESDVEDEENEKDDNTSSSTTVKNEEKYYKPVEKNTKDDDDDEVVYTGETSEREGLQTRKVTPVLPKSGSSDRLF